MVSRMISIISSVGSVDFQDPRSFNCRQPQAPFSQVAVDFQRIKVYSSTLREDLHPLAGQVVLRAGPAKVRYFDPTAPIRRLVPVHASTAISRRADMPACVTSDHEQSHPGAVFVGLMSAIASIQFEFSLAYWLSRHGGAPGRPTLLGRARVDPPFPSSGRSEAQAHHPQILPRLKYCPNDVPVLTSPAGAVRRGSSHSGICVWSTLYVVDEILAVIARNGNSCSTFAGLPRTRWCSPRMTASA
jgi:hypothetical protein